MEYPEDSMSYEARDTAGTRGHTCRHEQAQHSITLHHFRFQLGFGGDIVCSRNVLNLFRTICQWTKAKGSSVSSLLPLSLCGEVAISKQAMPYMLQEYTGNALMFTQCARMDLSMGLSNYWDAYPPKIRTLGVIGEMLSTFNGLGSSTCRTLLLSMVLVG
ncbi:hypothetical protein EMCRGX_G030716 [Ephydatia muelleri]